jgi:hypothetical protein
VLHAGRDVVEWNAKIDPGLQIRGVVRYRDGEPMTDVFVGLGEPGSRRQQSLVNDKQGRFRFVRLEKKAYDISVQVWNPPQGSPPVEAREIWPDSGEIEIVAAFDSPKKLQPGSVRGVISDVAQRLANPSALQVILTTDHGSWWTQSNLSGASFHFKNIEPGRVRVIAMSGEDPILRTVGRPASGRTEGFGTLVTEPGGKPCSAWSGGPAPRRSNRRHRAARRRQRAQGQPQGSRRVVIDNRRRRLPAHGVWQRPAPVRSQLHRRRRHSATAVIELRAGSRATSSSSMEPRSNHGRAQDGAPRSGR